MKMGEYVPYHHLGHLWCFWVCIFVLGIFLRGSPKRMYLGLHNHWYMLWWSHDLSASSWRRVLSLAFLISLPSLSLWSVDVNFFLPSFVPIYVRLQISSCAQCLEVLGLIFVQDLANFITNGQPLVNIWFHTFTSNSSSSSSHCHFILSHIATWSFILVPTDQYVRCEADASPLPNLVMVLVGILLFDNNSCHSWGGMDGRLCSRRSIELFNTSWWWWCDGWLLSLFAQWSWVVMVL